MRGAYKPAPIEGSRGHLHMVHAAITGIGAYLPERRLTNLELEGLVDTSDEWITSRTGISERRVASAEETTALLGARAAEAALADAGLTAGEIDLIVLGTSSPDHILPSTASQVQRHLGATCPAHDVMAACTGFIYALHHAASAIESGRIRRALVIGSESITHLVDFTDRTTCVLFGDGAGAVVLEAAEEPGVLGIDLGCDGNGADFLTIPAGGAARPCNEERVANREQYIKMVGSEIFKFAVRVLPQTTARALELSGLTLDDVRWLIPHQANKRIIDAAADRLGIDQERVVCSLELTGNTSAASIPLAMHELYTDGQLNPGDVLALIGFGAGLTWGGAIVRWTKGPAR